MKGLPGLLLALCGLAACNGAEAGLGAKRDEPIDEAPFTPAAATVVSAGARCQLSKLAPPALRRLTRREIESTIRDVFAPISGAWSGPALGPDPLSNLQLSNDHSVLLVDEQTQQQLATTAKEVASLAVEPEHLAQLLPCAAAEPNDACAAELVDEYGSLLYRRPLAAEEAAELLEHQRSVAARSDFVTSVKWTLVALLQAPQFLYRSEVGDEQRLLSQYELATQLAYDYGGTAPTRELLERASLGELATAEARRAVAEQLLQTPGGRAQLAQFFREWTGYERLLGMAKDQVFEFSVALAPQLVEETRRFFESVVQQNNGTVADLLTSPATFLNAELSTFYGYGSGQADEFSLVERPAGRGVGLLAQGSILASRAHYDFTSPVFRGLFVYSQLLCREPPARPMVVPELPAVETSTPRTTRERFESQHAQGACAACHQAFEPFGYALEGFDHLGRHREREQNIDIDAHALLSLGPDTTVEVNGLEELAWQLASWPEVADCVSGMLASYVFAGAGGQSCLAEDSRTKLANGELGLRDYYVALSNSPSFTRRARVMP